MQFIIFGAPGAGKGTQSKILCDKYNLKHISTGDLLREEMKTTSEMGKIIKDLLDRGEFVPDEIVEKLLYAELKSLNKTDGFIVDGYPRTVSQAKKLTKVFEDNNLDRPDILYLTVDENVILDRLSSRRQCSKCDNIVHIYNGNDKVCPKCNESNSLFRRDDDNEELIKKRIRVSQKNTHLVIEYFRTHGEEVFEVVGTDTIEKVTENIVNKISQK